MSLFKMSREELDDYKARLASAEGKLTEQEWDAISQKGFQLGQVAALEEEASRLRKEAGEAYGQDKDDEAKSLRRLATALEDRAKKDREIYNHNFPNRNKHA